MNSDRDPKVYIIAGPNGAGKTTFATKFLPHYVECMEFVNADLIASALSPFLPDRAAFRAGRLMIEQIHSLADSRVDFGFETTLAGRGYVRLLNNLKDRGYRIHLFYLWIHSIDVALERIAGRVKMGGHNVPEDVVRRRYYKGISNFSRLYQPLTDSWAIYDNSTDTPHLIAYKEHDKLEIIDHDTFYRISNEMRE
jgi:predicted ABC-type ATPase